LIAPFNQLRWWCNGKLARLDQDIKGTINYVDGVTISLLVSMKISKGQSTTLMRDKQAYRFTINVVDCPFDIFIETSKFTVTPST
jgi:hypothetical protein